jgi:hypothetical protein
VIEQSELRQSPLAIGVILTVAGFQAEGKPALSEAEGDLARRPAEIPTKLSRGIPRPAEVRRDRDDAFKRAQRSKLDHYAG